MLLNYPPGSSVRTPFFYSRSLNTVRMVSSQNPAETPDITPKQLKIGENIVLLPLNNLFHLWQSQLIPSAWKKCVVLFLSPKGHKANVVSRKVLYHCQRIFAFM